MEIRELTSWFELERELVELESVRSALGGEGEHYVSPLIFRGQANASWRLQTTLERYTNKEEMHAFEYFRIVERARPQIETYAGKSWDIVWDNIESWCEKPELLFLKKFPAPEYMIYLRHHGFPSPFLDWTNSPFVATHFAFDNVSESADRVAIYAYIEWAGRGKAQDSDGPVISTLPSNIRSHRRHFLQQSEYTICAADKAVGAVFSSHERALSIASTGENLLWKFTLPVSDRINVLKKLDLMNINSLSLFDNEESLMATMALRAFFLENA